MNSNLIKTSKLSKRSLTTRRITVNALFAALYVVFACLLTVKTPVMEISFASVPVIFSAILLGPIDALLVALVGSFIEQLVFGLSATAPLWMLPPILQGLTVGLLACLLPVLKRTDSKVLYRTIALLGTVCIGELILTATNTAALYLDGFLVGYPVKALNLIVIPRLANCAIRMAISCILVYFLLPPVQKLFTMRKN